MGRKERWSRTGKLFIRVQHNDDLNYAPQDEGYEPLKWQRNAEDVENKLQMWQNDIRLLLDSRQEQDIKIMENNDQMITILISMSPDRVVDEMEVALQEHMMKIVENSLKSKSGRKIVQVANQFGEGGEEEEDWQQHWDAQGGEYWIRTAMKRPRTEEHEFLRNRMQEQDTREVRKGNVEG